MTLRIAMAVVRYFEFGGMQRTYRRIAECLRDRGHDVTLLAESWEGDLPDGVSVDVLPVTARTNHGRNVAFGRRVIEHTTKVDFDVVVGFNKLPGLDVYYGGDPCFASSFAARRYSSFLRRLPRYRSYLRQERAVFQAGEKTEVMLIAHGEKERFQHHYGTEDERFHLLPPGIDRDRLARQSEKAPDNRNVFWAERGIDPARRILLNVGSGHRTKGVDRILRAVAAMPVGMNDDVAVVVVGAGRAKPFRDLARRLDLDDRQFFFLGPDPDVVPYYRHADLLVHPARVENTGTTLIEAMWCGLPVVVTANCGFAHHVADAGAGTVLDEPFVQGALDAVLPIAMTSRKRDEWGRAGVEYCATTDLYSLIERAAECVEGVGSRRADRRC